MGTPPTHARIAVSALFLLNGAAFANIVPRYPEIKTSLELSNSGFGLAVAAYPLGALAIGLLGGALVRRWGSARVAPASIVLLATNLVLIGTAPTWWVLAIGLFIAGSLDSVADIANNAHGLRVERLYGRSILNSMHGLWSVGAVLGGLMGASAAGLGLSLGWHLSGAGTLIVILAWGASRWMLPGADRRTPEPEPGAEPAASARPSRWPQVRVLVALGVIAAAANIIEDVGATWSAVYLRGPLASGPVIAGLGFISMQACQTVGRFAGDGLVTRFGDRAVARLGACVACIAMTAALAVPAPVTTIVAFGAVGAGIGTLIPGAIRTAERLPGLSTGTGLTWVSTIIRVGLLLSPGVVGVVADLTTLRLALAAIPVAALTILVLSRSLSRRAA